MRTTVHTATPEYQVAYDDLTALMRRHADKVTAIELLAIAANMVGKIMALQDQRKVTPAMAIEVVRANIEEGNQQVIDQLTNSQQGRA